MFDNLYIHIPFCLSKCGYCAFYSIPTRDYVMYDKYITSMEERMADFPASGIFNTIYFGGGTPSSLPSKYFERLFLGVNANFQVARNAEISVECNPETINERKGALISAYANRISLGVQSFSEDSRNILSRNAGNEDIENAVGIFKKYGIKNLSIDLIYALPGQTLENWLDELKKAVDIGIQHISCYSLTIEEGTLLADNHGLDAVNDELSAEMWYTTEEFLQNHGLDKCPDKGIRGFKRYVSLAVLARNLQHLGALLIKKEKQSKKRSIAIKKGLQCKVP